MTCMTGMDEEGLAHLLRWVQDGVVSRRQLFDLGAEPHDLRRWLRRGRFTPVHPGVYVEHNGPTTWDQRAWAAVLLHEPCALTRESALPRPPDRAPVQVAIGLRRSVRAVPGVVAHRTAHWEDRVRPGSCPPRLRIEEAAVEAALHEPDPGRAYRLLAEATWSRQTDARTIAATLGRRRGGANHALLAGMLDDLALGACSVLEREYLHRVERAHGLPCAERQVGATAVGRVQRDVEYRPFAVVVELDGRAFHESPQAFDQDLGRDLATAALRHGSDRVTLRVGWGQVLRDACSTAGHVGDVLRSKGWEGTLRRCPQCPRPVGS